MDVEVTTATYGKAGVRILSWPDGDHGASRVRDAVVDVQVEGQFLDSFLLGDNRAVLPSDTFRRHVLSEAGSHPDAPIEAVLDGVSASLLSANPALSAVTLTAALQPWVAVGQRTYVRSPWQRLARVRSARDCSPERTGGLQGLSVLATGGSAFTGFLRDALTIQVEATDRPLCGTLGGEWSYAFEDLPAAGVPGEIVDRIIATFADRPSNAVQQLLTETATSVLLATPGLATLTLHFESQPTTAVALAYEVSGAPLGITEVTVRRP